MCLELLPRPKTAARTPRRTRTRGETCAPGGCGLPGGAWLLGSPAPGTPPGRAPRGRSRAHDGKAGLVDSGGAARGRLLDPERRARAGHGGSRQAFHPAVRVEARAARRGVAQRRELPRVASPGLRAGSSGDGGVRGGGALPHPSSKGTRLRDVHARARGVVGEGGPARVAARELRVQRVDALPQDAVREGPGAGCRRRDVDLVAPARGHARGLAGREGASQGALRGGAPRVWEGHARPRGPCLTCTRKGQSLPIATSVLPSLDQTAGQGPGGGLAASVSSQRHPARGGGRAAGRTC